MAKVNKEEKLTAEEKIIGKISSFFDKNLLKVVIAIVVLAVVIAAVCIVVSNSEKAKADAMLKSVELEKRYNDMLAADSAAENYKSDYNALVSELLAQVKDSSYPSVKCEYLAGLCYYDLEDYQNAYDAFMKAYELNKTIYLAPLAVVNAASCAEAMGNVDQALELFNGISDEFGEDCSVAPKALFNVARIYLQKGENQLAKTTFEQLKATYPSSEYGKLAADIANVM